MFTAESKTQWSNCLSPPPLPRQRAQAVKSGKCNAPPSPTEKAINPVVNGRKRQV